jgi:GH15 family glucan-1,4-alpha-glucosidase
MAWVAFDRAIKGVEFYGLKGPAEHWRQIRAEIHDEICARAFNANLGAFTQVYDSDVLDASALLIPQVGFLPPEDARVQGTVGAIERRLLRSGFVLRYDTAATADGLPPGEGAFLPSSFWLADAYVMTGRTADAQHLFKRLIGLCNDVGLLAEEYDVGAQRLPSVLAYCADQYGIQSRSCGKAVRAAFRARTDRRPIEALPAREPAELSSGVGTRVRRTRSEK